MSHFSKKNFPDAVAFCAHKVIPPDCLSMRIKKWKDENITISTVNGSFDLLHAGHLHILYQASLQAELLLVALNSDASIQRYKSPHRPIISLESRLAMIAALAFVDFVTWFEQDDPRALLEQVRPHVHVNGAEYGENCIEAETVRRYGGRVHIVELLPGLSTSAIIAKMQGGKICSRF